MKKLKVVSFVSLVISSSCAMQSPVQESIDRYKESLPTIVVDQSVKSSVPEQIADYLLKFRQPDVDMVGKDKLIRKLEAQCEYDQPIQIILLGFPFKSTNREFKCIGPRADMAEYLALMTLQHLADQVQCLYEPSIHITIISDGLAYQTVIDETLPTILDYHEDIKKLLMYFPNLSFVGWEIHESIGSPQELIDKVSQIDVVLTRESEETKKDLKTFVGKEFETTHWKNHYKKIAEEECQNLVFKISEKITNPKRIEEHQQKAKTSKINEVRNRLIKDEIEKTTDSLSVGSIKFGTFVRENYPNYTNYIRLSVHPHADVGEKLGLALVRGQRGTPWHNAIKMVRKGDHFSFSYLDDKKSKKLPEIDPLNVRTYSLGDMELSYLKS